MRVHLFLLSSILIVAACGGGNNNPAAVAPMTVSTLTAPPALPEYEQPVVPVPGQIWTPGYWAYDTEYYWIPGTWVSAPAVGLLWTPPYWAWNENAFVFHEGWWGPQVGFYGGIYYGYGYFGSGFQGGMWQGGQFYYNQEAANVDITIVRNVYRTTVVTNNYVTRVSYNGGEGGILARENTEEATARTRQIVQRTEEQRQHAEAARVDPQFRASINHGKPTIAATTQAGKFTGPGVVKSKGAEPQETQRIPEAKPQHQPSIPQRKPQPEPRATTAPTEKPDARPKSIETSKNESQKIKPGM